MSRLPKKMKYLLIALCLALTCLGVFLAMRWMVALRDPQNLANFQQFISSMGFGGWVILLAIQYIQIVIAFIPGGPIQMIAGALFGPIGGLATCVLGMLLATSTVFSLVRRFGHRVINLFVGEKDVRQYRFLQDTNRLEFLVVILFLIPGTPKDVLTYLFALTPIPLRRFMLLSTVARIPAAMTSVLAGDSIAAGDWLKAVVYFVIIAVISLGGLVLHRKIMAVHGRSHPKR